MKRFFQFVVVLLLLTFLLLTAYLESQLPVVRLTENQVQETVSGMFPITGDKVLFDYTFSNPQINFNPGGQITLISDVLLVSSKRQVNGSVKIQAKPVYKAGVGEFYLEEPQVSRLNWSSESKEINENNSYLDGLKSKISSKLTDLKPLLNKASPLFKEELKERANQYFKSHPIYTLKSDSQLMRAIKLHVTSIRFDYAVLELRMNWAQNEVRLIVYLAILVLLSLATIKAFRKQ